MFSRPREVKACPLRPLRVGNTQSNISNAPGDGFDQIFRRADSHQVTRLVGGHARRDLLDHFQHYRLLFTDTESADSVSIKADLYRAFQTFAAQIQMRCALHDAKERLPVTGKLLLRFPAALDSCQAENAS